jgi:hypothetical protein
MYKIKNWNEHQPSLRPDRNVIWIKIYRRILEDYDWGNLSDSSKATLIELWLLASENEGNLPSVDEIAFRLRKDKSFINKQLIDLSKFVLSIADDSSTSCQQVVSLEVEVEVDKSRGRVEIDDGFNMFWNMYPKKVGKGKAEIAWKKHRPDIEKVINTLSWQKEGKDWFAENGKFIPHPTTWINGKRWLDEMPEEVTF